MPPTGGPGVPRTVFAAPVGAEHPLVLQPDAGAGAAPSERSFEYALRPDARQGPQLWYGIAFAFRITFRRSSANGFAWLIARTNGRAAVQFDFTTDRRLGRFRLRQTTVDILHGQTERRTTALTSAGHVFNYLTDAGVRGGPNVLSVAIEQTGAARVARVEIIEAAIVETDRAPFRSR